MCLNMMEILVVEQKVIQIKLHLILNAALQSVFSDRNQNIKCT